MTDSIDNPWALRAAGYIDQRCSWLCVRLWDPWNHHSFGRHKSDKFTSRNKSRSRHEVSGKEDAEGFVNSIEYVLWQQMFHGMVCQAWKLPRKSGLLSGLWWLYKLYYSFQFFTAPGVATGCDANRLRTSSWGRSPTGLDMKCDPFLLHQQLLGANTSTAPTFQVEDWRSQMANIAERGFHRYLKEALFCSSFEGPFWTLISSNFQPKLLEDNANWRKGFSLEFGTSQITFTCTNLAHSNFPCLV